MEPTPNVEPTSSREATDRPVLLWQEEGDTSRVEPSLEQAAEFLHRPVDQVRTAIEAGDAVDGWFVDWEASNA